MQLDAELDIKDVLEGLRMVEKSVDEVMIEAAELGATLVRDRAKTNHDYNDSQDATLTNSIEHGPAEGSFLAGTLEVEVAAGAPHGIYIEHGTNPTKKILPRHKKALRWPVEGGYHFSKGHVPGPIRAREFLSGALEHELDAVVEIFGDATEFAFEQAGLR